MRDDSLHEDNNKPKKQKEKRRNTREVRLLSAPGFPLFTTSLFTKDLPVYLDCCCWLADARTESTSFSFLFLFFFHCLSFSLVISLLHSYIFTKVSCWSGVEFENCFPNARQGMKKGCWLLWKRQPFTYEYIQRERRGRRRNKRHREWWGQPYRLQQTTLSLWLFSLLFLQDIPRTHSNSRGFLLLHLSPRALKKTFSSDKTKKNEREKGPMRKS